MYENDSQSGMLLSINTDCPPRDNNIQYNLKVISFKDVGVQF